MKRSEIDDYVYNQLVRAIPATAPLVKNGYVTFYELPVGWICGDCGQKVIPSKFERHVKTVHQS